MYLAKSCVLQQQKRDLSLRWLSAFCCSIPAQQHYGVLVHRLWRPLSGDLQTGTLQRLASTHRYTSNHLPFHVLQDNDSNILAFILSKLQQEILLWCSHLGYHNLLHKYHKDPKPASAVVVTATKVTKFQLPKLMVPGEKQEKERTSLIASSMMLLPMPYPAVDNSQKQRKVALAFFFKTIYTKTAFLQQQGENLFRLWPCQAPLPLWGTNNH